LNERAILCQTYLVELKANETSNQRRCSGDSRDDFAGNLLGVVSISRFDAIVHRPKIRGCGDEVNVVVGVVILLKFHRIEAETRQGGGWWE
jgi:hypothetical protein